jgi:phosphatidylserine synthase
VLVRRAARSFLFDALSVLLMVFIGTRNHHTDTGLTGVLFVAAPFWIGLALVHAVPFLQKSEARAEANKYMVWGYTVLMGMLLRHFVFDRGTALPFIIVATLFLGASMMGWRAVEARLSSRAN